MFLYGEIWIFKLGQDGNLIKNVKNHWLTQCTILDSINIYTVQILWF